MGDDCRGSGKWRCGAQLAARRAERELREEKEARLRLERQMEGWRGMRMDKGVTEVPGSGAVRSVRRSGQWPKGGYSGSEYGESDYGDELNVPKRKGSVSRQTSLSKGFL